MRTSLILLGKLVLTLAILGTIAWKLDFSVALHTLAGAAPTSIAVGLAVALVQAACAAGRLGTVVGIFGRRLPLRDSLRVTLEGIFFGQTFLSFVGADALRIWRIRRCGLPLEKATAAITLDRLIGTIVNHGLLLASLPWLLGAITSTMVRVGLLMLAVAGVAGTALVLVLGYLRGRTRLMDRLPRRAASNRAVRLLVEASTVGRHILSARAPVAAAVLFSIVILSINSLIFFVVLIGFGVAPATAFGCALLVPAVLEIAMLPISIAGWGVREGVVIVAFGALGVPSEIAFGTSVTFALIGMALGLVGGLLWLFGYREIEALAATDTTAGRTANGRP